MNSPSGRSARTHSIPLDDLDLQPVRELRHRVLNEVPDVQIEQSPRVKLHYVDVSLPKASSASNIDQIKSHRKRHGKLDSRHTSSHLSGTSDLKNAAANGGTEMAKSSVHSIENNATDGRRQFVSQLLRRGGVPVWEEVPHYELNARYLGFPDPHSHQRHHALNITERNNRSRKTNKVPSAVWEDVTDAPPNSRLKARDDKSSENQIAASRANDVNSSQTVRSRLELPNLSPVSSQSTDSAEPPSVLETVRQTLRNTAAPLSERSGDHAVSPSDHSGEHRTEFSGNYSNHTVQLGSPSTRNTPQHTHNVNLSNPVAENDTLQNEQVVELERPSRIVKRIFGGRLTDDNNIIGTTSWRIGEKAVREKYGPVARDNVNISRSNREEEEKHEKEPTKETPKKRDLSAPSKTSDQPSKKQQKFEKNEENSLEKKTSPASRVIHYEREEVRKFMQKRRRARTKSNQEQKIQKEQDKIKKEERMKELAQKTKELAQVGKKERRTEDGETHGNAFQFGTKMNSKPNEPPNWGCPSDCYHEGDAMNDVPDFHQKVDKMSSTGTNEYTKRKQQELQVESERNKNASKEKVESGPQKKEKDEKSQNGNAEKRRRKDRKKKVKRAFDTSCSESISDLVSRTVEECERHLRSSSISISSVTSSASIDISDSESRSNMSPSGSSSIDLAPNQRIVSLDHMAQNLTTKITEEEENLKHFLLANRGMGISVAASEAPNPKYGRDQTLSSMHNIQGSSTEPLARGSGEGAAKNQSGVGRTSREPLTYTEIELLSVEELKSRMTAMLLPNSQKAQERSHLSIEKDIPQNRTVSKPNEVQYQNPILKEKTKREDDYPSLSVPPVPELQLSSGGRLIIGENTLGGLGRLEASSRISGNNSMQITGDSIGQEKLVDLPGNNVYYVNNTPIHTYQFGVHKLANEHQKGRVYPNNNSKKNEFERAALCIQSAYRGYRVRKVTSALLKKDTLSAKLSNKQSHISQRNNWPLNLTKRSGENDHPAVKNTATDDIDWRKIRKELNANSYKPTDPSGYVFQRTDLPEWVKPYVILSETGNANNFLKNRMNDAGVPFITDSKLKQRDGTLEGDHIHNPAKSDDDSDKENIQESSDSMLEATLLEEPISDLELGESVIVHEKGTQTPKQHKHIHKKKDEKEVANIRESVDRCEFVDMKNHDNKHSLLLNSSKISIEEMHYKDKSTRNKESLFPDDLDDKSRDKSCLIETSPHDETLEEGRLEDDIEEGRLDETSKHAIRSSHEDSDELGIAHSSLDVKSSDVSEEHIAPHHLLGRGPHFGPANLRLRLNAELMYQDTVDEALNQLQDVEHLHSLSRTQENHVAFTRSFLLQEQEKTDAYNRLTKEKLKQAEEKKEKEDQEYRRKELEIQQEALVTVERIEKEAKERLDQLERDIRARAEQIMSLSQRPLEHSAQPEVIATAAVAAVGATISHWERLKQVQGVPSVSLQSQSALIHNQHPETTSVTHSQQYTTTFTDSSSRSQTKVSRSKRSFSSSRDFTGNIESYSSVSEKISIMSNDKKSSIIEELSHVSQSSSSSSVRELVHSEGESARSSVSEAMEFSGSCKTTHSESSVQEAEDLAAVMTSRDKQSSESIKTVVSGSEGREGMAKPRLSRSKEKLPGLKKSRTTSSTISEIASAAEDSRTTKGSSSKVSEDSIQSEIIEASKTTNASPEIPSSEVKESIRSSVSKTSKSSSEMPSSDVKESIHTSFSKTSKASSEKLPSEVEESIQSSISKQNSLLRDKERDSHSIQEVLGSSKATTGITSNGSVHTASKEKESTAVTNNYSESFEAESMSDSSSTSIVTSPKRSDREYKGDMTLVVSGNILGSVDQLGYRGVTQVGNSNSALGMTLNIVESLQKEEEIRLQHQTALLKLQEQSLIEEARWKLAALQSEGGSGIRKRQRAVLLQLREQRTHLRRLIEAQNLAAQQRRLLLLQHHHLLATTSGISASGNKGFQTSSRGHSPNPSSPRLTPRMMEISISSSSEGQEDLSLHLSVKSKETGSSSLSDSSGREKRRSHSDERKRMTSARLQEKRRAMEADTLQKSKSLYDNQEKDSIKTKRKIDISSKRGREKREKSPITPVRIKENSMSTESSVPEESIDVSTHGSESSIQEEEVSESVSHSDVASSVSEHEGSFSAKKQSEYSVPEEAVSGEKSSVEEILTKSKTNESQRSSIQTLSSKSQKANSKSEAAKESSNKTKGTDSNSTIKTLKSDGTGSQGLEKTSSIQTLLSEKVSQRTEKTDKSHSDTADAVSKSTENPSTLHTGTSRSDRHSSSKSETIGSGEGSGDTKSRSVSSKTASYSGSEGRATDSKSNDSKSSSQRSYSRALPLALKVPLSPRPPHRQQRRYSSESDDSFTLSQTETASEASDGEGKLIALKEQLASRRAEADRLKREKRRMRRERLASQEQALRQQIANYDAYIQQAKSELERESRELQQVSQVRPLIKKPQVAESKKLRQNESLVSSPDKSDVSDISGVSESKTDHSVSSKSQEINLDHSLSSRLKSLKSEHSLPSKAQEIDFKVQPKQKHKDIDKVKSRQDSTSAVENIPKAVSDVEPLQETASPHSHLTGQDVAETSKDSHTSSVSEEYSFEEESVSEQSAIKSMKKSLSRDSSQDTDQSPSQASSTETIVHSPKKLDSGQKDGEISMSPEIDDNLQEKEDALQDQNESETKYDQNIEKKAADSTLPNKSGEVEKKLEIFIPTPHAKAEADESSGLEKDTSAEDKDTSMEDSIGEEIVEDNHADSVQDVSVDNLNKNILDVEEFEADPAADQDADKGEPSVIEEKSDTLSKGDSILSRSDKSQDSSTSFDAQDLQKLVEAVSAGKSSDRQRQVDDISNSILASLMKETTLLFTEILKGKEEKSESVTDSVPEILAKSSQISAEQDLDESNKATFEAEDIQIKDKNQLDKSVQEERRVQEVLPEADTSISKSQVLKRVNDLIVENESSPRSASLSSPRPSALQLAPQLTFDISPATLSPVSPSPASPTKFQEEKESAVILDSSSVLPAAAVLKKADADESQGASPSHDIIKAEDYSLDMAALTSKLLNLTPADLDIDSKFDQIEVGDPEFSVEGIEGNWFDDDFWASADTKKRQQQLKAEEERIAAEIARLEELQKLQEQFPGLVIREVPNKPPPPYTPPSSSSSSSSPTPLSPTSTMPPAYRPTVPADDLSSELQSSSSNTISIPHRLSKADLRKLATEIFHVVPSAEEDALPILTESLECLYEALERSLDPNCVEPPSKFIPSSSSSNHSEDSSEEEEESCSRIFHHLLFSLARELVSEVYNLQRAPPPPPWIKQSFPPKQMLVVIHTKSKKALFTLVQEKIKVLFGWNPPSEKESLMLQWARKHRDLVDQVLVKELQAEESSWTCYDEDEASVKAQVANEILETLIDDTVTLFNRIIKKKMVLL